MMFTGVGGMQGSHRGPWMGEASPPQPDGTKAVGNSDWNPSGEHQVEKETGAAAGHTGQSPGHGARREAWRLSFPPLMKIGSLSACDTTFIFSFATDNPD